MSITKTKAATLAVQTAAALRTGRYTSATGKQVSIGAQVQAARQGTIPYPPENSVPAPYAGTHPTSVEVVNETTIAAGHRLHIAGLRPVALNFASAKNPGGGFLTGARAQEESLCRNSGLFACLEKQEYYDRHRAQGGGFYSDYALYSPDVPVIRDEDGNLLDEPWPLAFITCPAPNARALKDHGNYNKEAVEHAFESRIRRVLNIGALHGHPSIVLGAWGCGAFGNDSQDIAPIFGRVLNEIGGVYERVVFAVLDNTSEEKTMGPFKVAFPLAG